MLKISTIRNATVEELNTLTETIPYSRIESYCRRIENNNLETKGKSICAGSMHLPYGLVEYNMIGEDAVCIHKNWKRILKDAYENNINPIMVEVN